MIISASRRTDIPAFYAPWFINRIRAGFCNVPNPMNPRQVSEISLRPNDVDVIVFWTRNPRPLMPYLAEMDRRGYHYYVQYTVLGYPSEIDKSSPPLKIAVETLKKLAEQIGPQRVIWRYDPILLTNLTNSVYHIRQYQKIANALKNYTLRSVISVVDPYSKNRKRMANLTQTGFQLLTKEEQILNEIDYLVSGLVKIAQEQNMEIVSCAEEIDLRHYGVQPGHCIDADYIERVFNIQVSHQKDPGQRKACGCVVSKDIGMYDSCPFGCVYCYATASFERSRIRYANHDPHGDSLINPIPKSSG